MSILNEKMLTIELGQSGDVVEIHANRKGLEKLIQVCTRLYEDGGHEHLASPSWGGDELTEEKQGETNTLLNKLTIHLWEG